MRPKGYKYSWRDGEHGNDFRKHVYVFFKAKSAFSENETFEFLIKRKNPIKYYRDIDKIGIQFYK